MQLESADVCLGDIAHHLSNLCRFTGAVRSFYSVAQHTVLVSLYCDPADALWGLLHDSSEAYLVDVPRPLKHAPEFAFYREVEERATKAIMSSFQLPHARPASVSVADARILATEARDLMAPLHPDWRVMASPYARVIRPLPPESARAMFLARYKMLTENPLQAWKDAKGYDPGELRGVEAELRFTMSQWAAVNAAADAAGQGAKEAIKNLTRDVEAALTAEEATRSLTPKSNSPYGWTRLPDLGPEREEIARSIFRPENFPTPDLTPHGTIKGQYGYSGYVEFDARNAADAEKVAKQLEDYAAQVRAAFPVERGAGHGEACS
jgi:uncharacterized protein